MVRRPCIAYHGKPLYIYQLDYAGVSPISHQNNSLASVSSSDACRDLIRFKIITAYDARLVDIWACGIVYYCMQFQELPWRVAQATEPLFTAYAQACSSKSDNNNTTSYPATINTLSPRTCRPVIRKMIEPDPKKRWSTKDILASAWLQGIEVCVNSSKPSHVHAHARAMLQSHYGKMQDGGYG